MTENTAAFTILYDGWLLAQNRITTEVFNHVMDKYDERWARPEDRQKVVAAAHHTRSRSTCGPATDHWSRSKPTS
jgi:hypothetical protein